MTNKKSTGKAINTTTKAEESSSTKLVSGLAIIGAVAAAGAYFLYGTKDGAKKRKKVSGWMLQAKGEVLEKLESVKDLSEDKYVQTVAGVINKYRKLKRDHGDEVEVLYNEMMSYWKHIKRELKGKEVKKSKSK